jgi:hypothetical protein
VVGPLQLYLKVEGYSPATAGPARKNAENIDQLILKFSFKKLSHLCSIMNINLWYKLSKIIKKLFKILVKFFMLVVSELNVSQVQKDVLIAK